MDLYPNPGAPRDPWTTSPLKAYQDRRQSLESDPRKMDGFLLTLGARKGLWRPAMAESGAQFTKPNEFLRAARQYTGLAPRPVKRKGIIP